MSACKWILNAPTTQKWKILSENSYLSWLLVVLWPRWNHYGKAWRSICRKNDIRERWWGSKHVINGYDHICREWSHSLGKVRVPRHRAWEASGFVSNFECCSSSRATIGYRKKSCKMLEDIVRCSSLMPSLAPGREGHFYIRTSPEGTFSGGASSNLFLFSTWVTPPLQRLAQVVWALSTLMFPQEIGSSLCISMLAENMSSGPATGLGFVWPFPRAHRWHLPYLSTLIRNSCGNSSITTPGRDMLPDVPLRQ